MTFVILLGFIAALLFFLPGKLVKKKLVPFSGILPFGLFIFFASYLPGISQGEIFYYHTPWIPTVGANLDFKIDGLSLLFALLITGIGTLIYLYASSYLQGHPYINRFFAYLSMFMSAMLGIVLSDNLLLLFIFWELTSISSFFLIGFDNEVQESRKNALTALAITGGGGFLLMAGFILIGYISGTYSLAEILSGNQEILREHTYYPVLLVLLFCGAFTKSAQFPFHFWLPGAMKAPTPVSAYLHSATMVKAGIYLLARFTPLLGGHIYWNYPLMAFGGVTMLYGAFHSLLRTDMKSILAYSTISALGILVFLLGIGTDYAVTAAVTFILVHALYKAALFLITGVVDHETGTRDVNRLGGLRKVLMPVFIAGIFAAFSNAGIPLTFGFIGKDLIYEATLHFKGSSGVVLTAAAMITNIFLLYAGFMVGLKPFTGKMPREFSHVHLPQKRMWLPPLLLGILGILFGLIPSLPGNILLSPASKAVLPSVKLLSFKIWHGLNLVLLLSVCTICAGLLLYFILKPGEKALRFIQQFQPFAPKALYEHFTATFKRYAFRYTRIWHNGYLRFYIRTIVIFFTLLVGYRLLRDVPLSINMGKLSGIRFYEAVVFAIVVASIFKAVFTPSRLTAIIAMGIIGYCICLIFVFYGAPDLAMTQFTIDTLTVVLFVLVLFKLPSYMNLTNTRVRIWDGIVSLAFGVLISLIALQAFNVYVDKTISHFYAENAYILAKGKNVVNVILVDFRGTDTMIEIIVLTIAALGVFSLLKLNVKTSEKD